MCVLYSQQLSPIASAVAFTAASAAAAAAAAVAGINIEGVFNSAMI